MSEPAPNQEWAIVASGVVQAMQEMQAALAEAGLDARLVPPQDGSGKG